MQSWQTASRNASYGMRCIGILQHCRCLRLRRTRHTDNRSARRLTHTHTLTLSLHRSMSRSSDTTEHRPAPGRFVFSVVHWVETTRITRAEGGGPLGGANLYNDRLFFSRPRSEGWPHHGLRAWRSVMAAYRRVYDSRHLQADCQ